MFSKVTIDATAIRGSNVQNLTPGVSCEIIGIGPMSGQVWQRTQLNTLLLNVQDADLGTLAVGLREAGIEFLIQS